MSAIVELVTGTLNLIYITITEGIEAAWAYLWDEILNPILEPIMGLFGFEDRTVVAVAVYSTPLYKEEYAQSLTDSLVKSTIVGDDTFTTIEDLILNGGSINLDAYYRYGRDHYVNALPSIKSTYNTFNLLTLERKVYQYEYDLTLVGSTPIDALESPLPVPVAIGHPPITMLYEKLEPPQDDYLYRSFLYNGYIYNTLDNSLFIDGKTEYLAIPTYSTYASIGYVETALPGVTLPREDTDITVNFLPWVTTGTTVTVEVYENDVLQSTVATPSTSTLIGLHTDIDGVVVSTPIIDDVLVDTTRTITTTEVTTTTIRRTPILHTVIGSNARYYQAVYSVNARNPGKLGYYSASLYATTLIEGAGETTPSTDPDDDFAKVFPVVPLKSVGAYVDANKASDTYITSRKILKTLHLDIDTLIAAIKDSPDIENIHTAGIALGVNLATENPACKKYIYNFFAFLYSISFNGTRGTVSTLASDTALFGVEEGAFNSALTYKSVVFTSETGSLLDVNEIDINIVNDHTIVLTKGLVGGNQEKYIFNDVAIASIVKQALTTEVGLASFKLSSVLEENDFIVPLSLGLLKELSVLDRNAIAARCTHMYLYAGTYQELEWYQSEVFIQILGYVLMIIAFIWTGPGGSATVSAWIIHLIRYLAVSFVVGLVLDKLLEIAKDSDEEWVDALVFVAAVYLAITMGKSDAPMLLIDKLLLGVSAVAGAAALVITGNTLGQMEEDEKKLNALQNQYDKYEEQYKELFEPKNQLGYDIYNMRVESPEVFFARTLDVDTSNLALNLDAMLTTDLDYKLEV